MLHEKKKLRVLIIGLNYSPEMVGISIYTSGLAEDLSRRGHSVAVVAGKPYYPTWTIHPAFRGGWMKRSVENGVDLTRVAHFVPAHPTGLKRILHHISFCLSCTVPSLVQARRFRPDVVLTIAPSLIAAPVARIAAWICGARTWLHIQDFELEAALATGLVQGTGLTERFARWFEKSVFRSFDRVSSISRAMCQKLEEKGVAAERIVEFRNWTELRQIRVMSDVSPFRLEWQISTEYVALYSGNIANKQGITLVVEAARLLRHRKDLTFIICGEGPNLESLIAMAADLDNIVFKGLQPKERLSDLLGLATVHLLPQLADAADLVLPSKLTNMLASGRSIVATAAQGTGLADEVEGCGINVPPGDASSFASAIVVLLDDAPARHALGLSARKRAEDRWDKDAIMGRLEQQLFDLVQPDGTNIAAQNRSSTTR